MTRPSFPAPSSSPPSSRTLASRLLRTTTLLLSILVATTALAQKAPPPGASALDAWGAWREAEGKTYRLAEDGVRTFSCDVDSSLVQVLSAPGGPLEGDAPRIRLWWRTGDVRATVEGGTKLDADARGRLAAMVEPLAEVILPYRPSRGLVSHSFRFLDGDDWVRVGERGIEAKARHAGDDPARALIAIGPDGLVARERIERADGTSSEFSYEHVLRNNRYLLKSARGTFRGQQVSLELEWGIEVARRPLPTKLTVVQTDETAAPEDRMPEQSFTFTHHQVNGEIPDGILPELPPEAAPSVETETK